MRRDVYLKTKAIFEEITRSKIYVKFRSTSEVPFVERLNNKAYMIHFPVQNEEDLVDPYRSFEHEISHVIFTDFDKLKSLELLAKGFNNPRVPEIIHNIANLIEDLRIDTLWDEIYRGSKKRRIKQLNEIYNMTMKNFKNRPELITNPLSLLQFARFKCYGLNTSNYEKILTPEQKKLFNDFIEILEKVKNKGQDATIIATEAVIERILKEFDDKSETPILDKMKNFGNGKQNKEGGNESPENESETQENQENTLFNTIVNTLSKIQDIDEEKLSKTEIQTLQITKLEGDPEAKNVITKELRSLLKMGIDDLDEILKKSEEESEKLVKEIKKKIEEFDPQKKKDKPAYYKIKGLYYSSVPLNVRVNQSVVKKLTLLFQQIKFKYHKIIDEEGYDIDIDAYIQERFTRGSRIFKRYDRVSGSTVYFLIDLSGSMDSILEEELVALLTLTKALKKT